MTRLQMSGAPNNVEEVDKAPIVEDDREENQDRSLHETRAERERRDEPLKYTMYQFVSAIEGELHGLPAILTVTYLNFQLVTDFTNSQCLIGILPWSA